MRGGMVAHNRKAVFFIYRYFDFFPDTDFPGGNHGVMEIIFRMVFGRIPDFQNRVAGLDRSDIADLSAAFRVERRFIQHQNDFIARRRGLCTFAVPDDGDYFRGRFKLAVAKELRFRNPVDGPAERDGRPRFRPRMHPRRRSFSPRGHVRAVPASAV